MPVPDAYVKATMHGGPHDHETVNMPWARLEVPMMRWDGDTALTSLYRLIGPWRGQSAANYEFVEPAA